MSQHDTAPGSAAAFHDLLRSRGPTLNLLFEQARISPEREGDTLVRDAFAGAIICVLHGMLRAYWTALGSHKQDWRRAGPLFNGNSVGQILAAALDNARHFEEWDAEKTAVLAQRRSVRALCAVLGVPLKKNSKRPLLRGNVSWSVLGALCHGEGYGAIEAVVREFAAALQTSRVT